jgi:hypothetical protein
VPSDEDKAACALDAAGIAYSKRKVLVVKVREGERKNPRRGSQRENELRMMISPAIAAAPTSRSRRLGGSGTENAYCRHTSARPKHSKRSAFPCPTMSKPAPTFKCPIAVNGIVAPGASDRPAPLSVIEPQPTGTALMLSHDKVPTWTTAPPRKFSSLRRAQ